MNIADYELVKSFKNTLRQYDNNSTICSQCAGKDIGGITPCNSCKCRALHTLQELAKRGCGCLVSPHEVGKPYFIILSKRAKNGERLCLAFFNRFSFQLLSCAFTSTYGMKEVPILKLVENFPGSLETMSWENEMEGDRSLCEDEYYEYLLQNSGMNEIRYIDS